MKEQAMRLDGYVRVSRVGGRGGDSFISPDVQRRQIEQYARTHGYDVVAWHEDLDQSGGTINRPGFQAALARIERGETDGLVVPRLDRFGRSVPRIHEALERIERAGGRLLSVAEDFDLSTANGKAHFNMLGLMAQYQRDQATEAWDVSNARAIERGIHFTRQPPFGYQRGADRRLVPDPATAPLVAEIFRRRALRESRAQIASYLTMRCPRDGGRAWTAASIGAMIQNRAYLGEAFHGQHRNPDAHQPLVTIPEWEAANAVTGGPGPIYTDGALLAGLVRCAGCRYAMRRTFTRYSNGRRVEMYSCQVKHTGGKCPAPARIIASLIEPVVIASVVIMGAEAEWPGKGDESESTEAAQRQLAHAEARLRDFLADDELRQIVGRDDYLAEARKRQAQVDEARNEVAQAQRQQLAAERRTHTLLDEWPKWDRAKQGDLLRGCLDAVYVRKGRGPAEDRLLILWEGEDDFEKPRRGTTDYRTRPIPWPTVEWGVDGEVISTDRFAFNVPGLSKRLGNPLAEAATAAVAAAARRISPAQS